MDFEDRVTISTPEGVDVHLTLAGVGSRVAASIIDTVIRTIVVVGIFLATDALGDWGTALAIVAIFLVLFGYDIAFEVLASGRTPGKRWTGLRVIRSGGQPVGFLASAVRNLLRLVDFLPVMYTAAIVSVIATRRNQRLGDLAADTLVVRERRGAHTFTPEEEAATSAPSGAATWDVGKVDADELSTVRSFLARREDLSADARARIAWELAERLRPKVGGAGEELHPEVFLEHLAAVKGARR